jgi:hypothetical protein
VTGWQDSRHDQATQRNGSASALPSVAPSPVSKIGIALSPASGRPDLNRRPLDPQDIAVGVLPGQCRRRGDTPGSPTCALSARMQSVWSQSGPKLRWGSWKCPSLRTHGAEVVRSRWGRSLFGGSFWEAVATGCRGSGFGTDRGGGPAPPGTAAVGGGVARYSRPPGGLPGCDNRTVTIAWKLVGRRVAMRMRGLGQAARIRSRRWSRS